MLFGGLLQVGVDRGYEIAARLRIDGFDLVLNAATAVHNNFAVTQSHGLAVPVNVIERCIVCRVIAGPLEQIDEHIAPVVL